MAEITTLLLGISFILFFGFFAEFIFKKIGIPDILFLILLGFVIGPHILNYINPSQLGQFAPLFTTFALLFLIYDGAFNIDLVSIAKGLWKGLWITSFNFLISSLIVSLIMFVFGFDLLISLLTGVILGGISSAFVIPIIKQLKIGGETYFILTLESALTDVFCIVGALTVMEIIKLQSFSFKVVFGKIAALFGVAGLIGIVAGILWIIIVIKFFKENKSYMITIAYIILIYVISEFLNGNGAISALFLGLMLRNSKQLTLILHNILNEKKERKESSEIYEGVTVTTETEEFFYSQISFFLKTFFFVYIGLLLNITDIRNMIIASVIAISIMVTRGLSYFVTKSFSNFNRKLISSIFARGLAAAAIAQIVIMENIENAAIIGNIVYWVIGFSIVLSSIKIFFVKKHVVESTSN